MGSTARSSSLRKHSIPIVFLDDLCCRFIINLPPEDRDDLVRICFHIEQAHWFYLDYYVTDEANRLDPCGIREFAAHIFQHVPHLRRHASDLDAVLNNWREYKQTVPTYGAILLDTDLSHVLLVQSYWTKASWGFPKGKVNEAEEPWKCAAREVLEETGFDISKLINKNDYMEATIHEQFLRLYIIGYIPRDTKFQPRTRHEIKACEWFPLAGLPLNKKDMTPQLKMGVNPKAFFMVMPFVKRIRRWVSECNPETYNSRTRHKSLGDIDQTKKDKNKSISQGLQNEIQENQQQNSGHQYMNQTFDGNGHGNYNGKGNHNGYGNHNNGNGQGNHGNGRGHGSASKNNHSNRKERKPSTKRQLFTPQNTQTNNYSPEQSDNASMIVQTDDDEFAAHIFQHEPHLRRHASDLDAVLNNWREYKQTVPTYGAILLDTDLSHVLLVQSYWTKASWSWDFPRGKVNEAEEPWKCAAREVLEETGFDISKLINKNDYMEATIHDQIVRLYIIGYIPRDTKFQPRTRHEIKVCEWFPLAGLPLNKKDMTPQLKMGVNPKAFFMVMPFVKRIRRWVSECNPETYNSRTRHKSLGDIDQTKKDKNKSISQGLQNEIQENQQQNSGHQYMNQTFDGNGHGNYNGKGNHNGYGNHNNGNGQGNHGSGRGHGSASKNNHSNRKERKPSTKRQLFTPQNTQTNNSPPEQNEIVQTDDNAFFNFIAPSWANFKFDRRAILESTSTW